VTAVPVGRKGRQTQRGRLALVAPSVGLQPLALVLAPSLAVRRPLAAPGRRLRWQFCPQLEPLPRAYRQRSPELPLTWLPPQLPRLQPAALQLTALRRTLVLEPVRESRPSQALSLTSQAEESQGLADDRPPLPQHRSLRRQ